MGEPKPNTLPNGTVVASKYAIQRVIGKGATGVVYAAVHSFTGKHVALKLIPRKHADSDDSAARFLTEARAACQIGDPRIVDVLDAGREPDGSLYLVLELLEGENLTEPIKRSDLSVDEVVKIGVQMLRGLGAAHARGIVHRDVKPDNIFLTWDEQAELRVKILDFGIAKHLKQGKDLYSTEKGTVIGTPYYMSPEQAAAEEIDARTDIWSAGAVLFHALTGRPPFLAKTYRELISSITTRKAPSVGWLKPELPAWLVATVDRALSRDRADRWQTADQMAQALMDQDAEAAEMPWDDELEEETIRVASPFDDAEDLPDDPAELMARLRPDLAGRGDPKSQATTVKREDKPATRGKGAPAAEKKDGLPWALAITAATAGMTLGAAILWWLLR